jgi:hypothetical protein
VTDWLAPIEEALERVAEPCSFFFRDDDAGWSDAALHMLLDEFDGAGVNVDVAAIPMALSRPAARLLAERMHGAARVHQHGYAHVNHETAGRKCEFGPSRSAAQLAADVRAGRARLEDHLERAIDPVFTPPWNRCVPTTADAVLAAGQFTPPWNRCVPTTADAVLAAGHRVLSRDHTAGCLGRPTLGEVPVTIDWAVRGERGAAAARTRGEAIAGRIAAGGPVGVMLHHALLDDAERAQVRLLLELVGSSEWAVATTIVELAEAGAAAARDLG